MSLNIKNSFKQEIKTEAEDSDVIFVKHEVDLTHTTTDYETSVTHVSESKYFVLSLLYISI